MSGPTGNVLHPSLDSFQAEVMSSGLPTLVDFWAPWCPPCLMLKPELERLAPELAGRANLAFINVDEHPGLAEAFRVSSIPALFVLKGGRVVDSWTGFQSRQSLLGRLRPHLAGPGG